MTRILAAACALLTLLALMPRTVRPLDAWAFDPEDVL